MKRTLKRYNKALKWLAEAYDKVHFAKSDFQEIMISCYEEAEREYHKRITKDYLNKQDKKIIVRMATEKYFKSLKEAEK